MPVAAYDQIKLIITLLGTPPDHEIDKFRSQKAREYCRCPLTVSCSTVGVPSDRVYSGHLRKQRRGKAAHALFHTHRYIRTFPPAPRVDFAEKFAHWYVRTRE